MSACLAAGKSWAQLFNCRDWLWWPMPVLCGVGGHQWFKVFLAREGEREREGRAWGQVQVKRIIG